MQMSGLRSPRMRGMLGISQNAGLWLFDINGLQVVPFRASWGFAQLKLLTCNSAANRKPLESLNEAFAQLKQRLGHLADRAVPSEPS